MYGWEVYGKRQPLRLRVTWRNFPRVSQTRIRKESLRSPRLFITPRPTGYRSFNQGPDMSRSFCHLVLGSVKLYQNPGHFPTTAIRSVQTPALIPSRSADVVRAIQSELSSVPSFSTRELVSCVRHWCSATIPIMVSRTFFRIYFGMPGALPCYRARSCSSYPGKSSDLRAA